MTYAKEEARIEIQNVKSTVAVCEQIDSLVYDLYGLSEEEIKIVSTVGG